MIDKSKNNKALRAIQDLIIEARAMAYQNIDSKYIADFFRWFRIFTCTINSEW